jgi:glycogen(starch) synthase
MSIGQRQSRILFWCGTFWPNIGGVEVLSARLLPALQERGYRVTVVTSQTYSDGPEVEEYQGISVHRLPLSGGPTSVEYLAGTRRRLRALWREVAPDLVHANTVSAIDYFLLSNRGAHPAPLLVSLHGEWPSREDSLVRKTLAAADWVTGCSQAILERGRRLVPEIGSRSSVVYNGLDVPSLSPEPLPWAPPHLLYVGRLAHEKGVDLALEALAHIMGRFPQIRLTVTGDGQERVPLEALANQLGLSQVVDFAGWVDPKEVPALLNSATLVLVPSRNEALGLTALQSAMMGRPVVGMQVGGLPEAVVHGETGLLVPADDSRALAEAIVSLLENPQRAARMGTNARRRALKVFGWERYVDAHDTLYQGLCARCREARQTS